MKAAEAVKNDGKEDKKQRVSVATHQKKMKNMTLVARLRESAFILSDTEKQFARYGIYAGLAIIFMSELIISGYCMFSLYLTYYQHLYPIELFRTDYFVMSITFFLMMLLHATGALNLLRHCFVQLQQNDWEHRGDSLGCTYGWFNAKSTYGRNGSKYEVRLVLNQIVDVLSLTDQLNRVSRRHPEMWAIMVIAFCIIVVCISFPMIILKMKSRMRRRAALAGIDAFKDSIVGALMRVVFVSRSMSLFAAGGIESTPAFFRSLTELQMVLPVNFTDYITKTIPLFLSYFSLRSLMMSLFDLYYDYYVKPLQTAISNTKKAKIYTTEQHAKRRAGIAAEHTEMRTNWQLVMKWIAAGFTMTWGIVFFSATVYAVLPKDCGLCKNRLTPLFSSECACYFAVVDCKAADPPLTTSVEAEAAVSRVSGLTRLLNIRNCDLNVLPRSLEQKTELLAVDIRRCSLRTIDTRLRKLIHLKELIIDRCPMAEVSGNLVEIPESMESLMLDNTRISTLPKEVLRSWHNLRTLTLNHNPQENNQFLDIIPQLTRLNEIQLMNTSTTKLPHKWIPERLARIHLEHNQIRSISHSWFARFTRVYLDNNPLSAISEMERYETSSNVIHEVDELMGLELFTCANAPMCSNPKYLSLLPNLATACRPLCNPGCPKSRFKLLSCFDACNVAACNFHEGKCAFEKY